MLITENIERARVALKTSTRDWAELLSLTEKEYQEGLRGAREFPERSIEELAEHLGLTPENLRSGRIDFRALEKHAAGNLGYLPERYTDAAFSRRRTSSHLLEFLDIHYGWRARVRALRRFQLTEQTFADPDARIGFRFLVDLCEYLGEQGFGPSKLLRMGKFSAVVNYHGPLGQAFRRYRDAREAFEGCFTELIGRYYDENFDYRLLHLSDDRCLIEAVPSQRLRDALHANRVGGPGICALRMGAFASIPAYLGLPDAHVTERACIHRGDSRCLHEIDFGAAARAS
ncbi:MAG: hypothetical protein NDJ89_01755 [Oligoflexia bacterium]|nr:hypothetical protein [Oligoflexia bacterium]